MNVRFSLTRTQAELEQLHLAVTKTPTGLSVSHKAGRTIIDVEPVDVMSMDGQRKVREVVRVSQAVPEIRKVATPDFAAAWNRFAGTSCLLATTVGAPPSVFAKFPILDGDEGGLELYPLLVAGAAHMVGAVANYLMPGEPSASGFLRGLPAPPPAFFGLPTSEIPTFLAEDWQDAWDWIARRQYVSSADLGSLTVEFPFDEGAASAMIEALSESDAPPKRTTLLQLRTHERHPIFGPGLLALLRLPVNVPLGEAAKLADAMNRWEYSFVDLPPTIGAWTVTELGPAFSCFFPTALAYSFLPRHLTWWLATRAERARRWLLNAGYGRHD